MRKLISELTLTTCVSENNKNFIVNAVLGAIETLVDRKQNCYEDIKTALCEAVNNVITHAYPNKQGDISVCIYIYEDKGLDIKITDFGCGIDDVKKAMNPLFSTKNGCSGLGITFMEAFSEKVTVESIPGKGTVVIMTFKIV